MQWRFLNDLPVLTKQHFMQTNAKKLFDRFSPWWRVSSLFLCILKLITTYIVFKLKTKQCWLFKVWGICFRLWFQFIGEETVSPWRICSSLLWWKWSSSPRTLFLPHLYLHGHPRQKKTSLTFVFFHVNLGWWEHWNLCVLTGCFCLLKSDLSDIFYHKSLKKPLCILWCTISIIFILPSLSRSVASSLRLFQSEWQSCWLFGLEPVRLIQSQ